MNYGQQSNISAMRKYVYDLIRATTQKTAGQKQYAPKSYIDWDELDMLFMPIVIEATALVLSGGLERVEHYESIRIHPRIVAGAKRRQAAHSDARSGSSGGKYISGQAIRKRLRTAAVHKADAGCKARRPDIRKKHGPARAQLRRDTGTVARYHEEKRHIYSHHRHAAS